MKPIIINFGKVKNTVRNTLGMIREDRVGVYAAETAFFITLSAVPFLMLTATVASRIVRTDIDKYLNFIVTYIPGLLGEYFENEILSLAMRPMHLSISVLAVLWSASKGVRAVRRGVRSVYGKPPDKFLAEATTGLVFTLLFIVLIIALLVFLVFGDAVRMLIIELDPSLRRIFAVTVTFFPVFFAVLLIFFFALTFRAFTPKAVGMAALAAHIPGAILASVGWMLYTYLFASFLDKFSSMPTLYGSLGSIMILMLWIYMIMYIFLVGAEFNKLLFFKRKPTP